MPLGAASAAWTGIAVFVLALVISLVLRGTECGQYHDRLAIYLQRLDVNTATQSELEELAGIGPSLARAIIKQRPFAMLSDMSEVKGIGPHHLERLKNRLRTSWVPERFDATGPRQPRRR